jgi:putative ABC transport system permease protein
MRQIKGAMSAERRERLRQAQLHRWRGTSRRGAQRRLTPERIKAIADLPHVVSVTPIIGMAVKARYDGKEQNTQFTSASPADQGYRERIVAGTFLPSATGREVVVSEYLLYRWGVVNESDVEAVLGRLVRLDSIPERRAPTLYYLLNLGGTPMSPAEERVLTGALERLPDALKKIDLPLADRAVLSNLLRRAPSRPPLRTPAGITRELTICGVLRDADPSERTRNWDGLATDVDLVISTGCAREWFHELPGYQTYGFNQVMVRVDQEENLSAVHEAIRAMGLQPYSLAEVVQQVRFNLLLITFATSFIALVALVVAGLGITNTLLMSVLERTREIGIMKAVGARDRHVLLVFLVEGTLIGVLGGGLGLLGAWAASFPADRVARSLAEKQAEVHLTESLFVFPWWVTLGVPLFVSLLTMLAAVYPARRAARVNPITALRHE